MKDSYIKLIDDAKGDSLDGAPRLTSPVSLTEPVCKQVLGHRANSTGNVTTFLPVRRSEAHNVGYLPIIAALTCMRCMCQIQIKLVRPR